MRIGELARATGVEVETIRYYEKSGLLPAPPRSGNGYRHYGPAHLERLAFIRHCRALDIGLADVRRLLDYAAQPESGCDEVNRLIDEQLARVRSRLDSLHNLEHQLRTLRQHCSGAQPASECGILGELGAAAQGQDCACQPVAEARSQNP
ncbi:MAG: Cd(II)/Pb(II)-responsive transcriptional regulator [Pseudomonas sp.]|nr:Cd(II)/Pb(II)-responsive transcriptional regulator [Pseudomonas sp.]